MTKKILVASLGFLINFTSFGLEKKDEGKSLESKIHVDKNKNVYLNYKAPLYLRLSTSPNDSSPTVLWFNEGSKDRSKPPLSMNFKNPGMHKIAHFHLGKTVDPSTTFRLYLDSKGPKLNFKYNKVPRYFNGKDLYMGEPVELTLMPKDGLSGVKKTFISINERAFQEYNGPFTFNKEKKYDLVAYSIDNVGNRSHDKNINFIVDLTPPETSYMVDGLRVKNVFSKNVTIGLQSQDASSKVKKLYFNFDSPEYEARGVYKSSRLSMKKLPDGPYTLSYYAVDNVENKEETKEVEFYLDRTPPEFDAEIVGDQHVRGDKIFVSQRSKVNINAKDDQVAVKKIIWKYKKGRFKTFGGSFSLPKVLGKHEVVYKAVDELNNWTRTKRISLILDLLPPFVEQKFEGPYIPVFEKIFISKRTRINFEARDIGSGVQEIRYKINDSNEKVFKSPFKLTNEGVYNFTFFSIDNVNNPQTPNMSKVVVDNTPPEIYHHFSNTGLGKKETEDKKLTVYFPGSRLFLAASDKKSGTRTILYKMGGVQKKYKGPLELWKKGQYTIKVFAKDRVGNLSSKEFSFIIGNKI